jgi:hypothetical protein
MLVIPKRRESLIKMKMNIDVDVTKSLYNFYDYTALSKDILDFTNDIKKQKSELNIYYLNYISTL